MKLSVIIPVYNSEQYLPKCLKSVLVAANRLMNEKIDLVQDSLVEIICVNDGSTDGSAKILEAFAAENPCIRVITQQNSGVSVARNVGLEVAKGEWVHFMDSDDLLSEDFYVRIFKRIEETQQTEVVVTAMKSVYVDGSSRIPNGEMGVGVIVGDVLAQIFRTKRMGAAYCMADKVCRRKLLVDNGIRFMSGLHAGEDSLCCQSALAYAKCAVFDAENNAYCYWHHPGSLTTSVTIEKIMYQINAIAAKVALWQLVRTKGILLFAHFDAAGSLFLASNLPSEQQNEYCMCLIGHPSFKTILLFLLLHGSIKSRFAGLVLLMTPNRWRHVTLKILRKIRHA